MKQYRLNLKSEREFFTKWLKTWKAEKLFLALVNVGAKETSLVWA